MESDIDQKNRSEFFHVKVIFKHTKVDTLFDSGSHVNLISKEIVKKLGLKTTPHKNPYPLDWVCDDAKLQVTKQCKIKFAIQLGSFMRLIWMLCLLKFATLSWVVHIYLIGRLYSTENRINIIFSRMGLNILSDLIASKLIFP
jgi:hypothetical protein